jgi:polyisoprenoid-binding protein YceI
MRNYLFSGLVAIMLFAVLPSLAVADEFSFDVDNKFVNITFESKMDIEDIVGTSNKITGWVKFDGTKRGSFEIKVPVATLKTGIEMRDEHLRSAYWLDAEKHTDIVFKGESVKWTGKNQLALSGILSLHGVDKPLSVTVDARRISSEKAKKAGLTETNWLRIRGGFDVKLSAHGIAIPEMAAAKVNDKWSVKVSLFAKEK